MEGCCCLVCDGDGDMHLDGAHDGQSPVGRRRTAPETASVRKPTTWVELGACWRAQAATWLAVAPPLATKFTCRRRAANELGAQDAVAGLMALSNGQIQGTGVDKDSNSGDVGTGLHGLAQPLSLPHHHAQRANDTDKVHLRRVRGERPHRGRKNNSSHEAATGHRAAHKPAMPQHAHLFLTVGFEAPRSDKSSTFCPDG
uniref:Uncharacterized protein n=1 Tax=Oryza glumipatula TaxID=40148 RepID=A0A0D9ZZ18_9ORYZ